MHYLFPTPHTKVNLLTIKRALDKFYPTMTSTFLNCRTRTIFTSFTRAQQDKLLWSLGKKQHVLIYTIKSANKILSFQKSHLFFPVFINMGMQVKQDIYFPKISCS